jgi:hypothetical protein
VLEWGTGPLQTDVLLIDRSGRPLLQVSARRKPEAPLAEVLPLGTDLFIRAGPGFEVWDLSRLAPSVGL